MTFQIKRTSLVQDTKPCDEALLKAVKRVEKFRAVSYDKFKDIHGGWFDYGENHRMENGFIKRDVDENIWVLELETIDELIEFRNKYGNIILTEHSFNSCDNKSYPILEFYDDYRE